MKTHNSNPNQVKPINRFTNTIWLLLMLFTFFLTQLNGQTDSTGYIKILVQDKATKESIPFANVVFYNSKGIQVAVQTTNMDGECRQSLIAGIYNVKAVYVGYSAQEIKKVKVSNVKTTYITLALNEGEGVKLCEVEVVNYKMPLIDPDTKSGQTVTREDYQNMASKDVNSTAVTTYGVHSSRFKLRGGRTSTKIANDLPKHNTARYEESAENNFKESIKDPLSTFSSDVDAASYAIIRRMLTQGQLPNKEAVRIEEMINYFRYKYDAPQNKEAFAVHTEMSECPWNKEHKLLQIGLQGRSVEILNAQANYLTFLIDVSGSMEDEEKLPLLKKGLKMLVEQLQEKDRVAIVVYAGNAGLVLESTAGDKKEKIFKAIEALEAGGSTAGGEGIELAYKIAKENYSLKANNRVILATDGDFNVGISEDKDLIKLIESKRDDGIFLTVLGFGNDNYQDAKMEKLADKGNGNYAYVDNILEAKKVLVKEIGGTLITIAKDVKVQIEFNPRFVKEYRLIGYDNRMLAHEDFNNDKKDAGDIGSGHSVTALYEIIPTNNDMNNRKTYELKYQSTELIDASSKNEVCTIKLRYKEPKEKTSQLIIKTVNDEQVKLDNTSLQFRFCAAVVEMGLLLRESEYKAQADFNHALQMAKESRGEDIDGYRSEFIQLCETALLLAKK